MIALLAAIFTIATIGTVADKIRDNKIKKQQENERHGR